jgi:membrane protein
MHFLLVGRTSWRCLVRPAITTAVLWAGFGLLSSLYFTPLIVSDSRTYGTIGVVFTLLTWFFLIGAILVLGGRPRRGLATRSEAR